MTHGRAPHIWGTLGRLRGLFRSACLWPPLQIPKEFSRGLSLVALDYDTGMERWSSLRNRTTQSNTKPNNAKTNNAKTVQHNTRQPSTSWQSKYEEHVGNTAHKHVGFPMFCNPTKRVLNLVLFFGCGHIAIGYLPQPILGVFIRPIQGAWCQKTYL